MRAGGGDVNLVVVSDCINVFSLLLYIVCIHYTIYKKHILDSFLHFRKYSILLSIALCQLLVVGRAGIFNYWKIWGFIYTSNNVNLRGRDLSQFLNLRLKDVIPKWVQALIGGEGFVGRSNRRRHLPKIRTFQKFGQIFLDRQTDRQTYRPTDKTDRQTLWFIVT